jgi:vacuolar-type H+-ATPase subunit I/STV1
MGKPVNRDHRRSSCSDDEIADALRRLLQPVRASTAPTTRSSRILPARQAPISSERAKKAEFDERIALLGLILDGICKEMREVLDEGGVLMSVRDDLRALKDKLIAGDSANELFDAAVLKHHEQANLKQKRSHNAADARAELRVVEILHELEFATKAKGGQEAFDALQAAYQEKVAAFNTSADVCSEHLDNAFSFIETVFGNDREMLVFVTELTARSESSQFISQFGSETYYAHNQDLMVEQTRDDLIEEIDELEEEHNKR